MALWTRENSRPHPSRAAGRVDPSQRRRQYCAIRYGNRLAEAGAVASIGSVGDSFDNALAESVIGLYKTECVRRDGPARSAEDLELATASWVHWFNIHRLHSMIGNVPPVKYEQNYYASQPDREAPISGEPSLHWSRFPPPRHR
jgi:putative transposase